MTHAIMSNTDYKGICDTVRTKTGTTALLKSAEVAPAIRSIELSTTSLTLTVTTEAGATVTATKGSLSVSAVATNGTAVLKLKEAGEWTVTASLNGETSTVLVSVTDSYELTLQYLPPIGTALNDMSWADISKVAKAGLANQYFSVGDRKQVVLNGSFALLDLSNFVTYCFIIGIDHNKELEGENLIHFQLAKTGLSGGKDIAFVDSKTAATTGTTGAFIMNDGSTNDRGWEGSRMRANVCSKMLDIIPTDLRAVVAPVTKYTNNYGQSTGSSVITATEDFFFLLSMYEVTGTTAYVNTNEASKQQQYAYYSAGNSQLKYRHNSDTTPSYWWLRSAYPSNDSNFAVIDSTGSSYRKAANYSYGFSPAFCVGGV